MEEGGEGVGEGGGDGVNFGWRNKRNNSEN